MKTPLAMIALIPNVLVDAGLVLWLTFCLAITIKMF